MFRRKKKRDQELQELRDQNEQLSTRCAEHQTHVEVANEAMNRNEAALMEFLRRLHHTMGGKKEPTCEEDTIADLRRIRAQSDMYLNIRAMLAGRFNADEALVRRIACAVGTSMLDVDSVVERAGQLSQVHAENIRLNQELEKAQRRIEALDAEDERY